MRYIKTLFIINCLCILMILLYFYSLYYVWGLWGNKNVIGDWVPYFYVSNQLFLLISLCITAPGLWSIIKQGGFSNKANALLKKGGVIILLLGIINLIVDIYSLIANNPNDIDVYTSQIMLSFFMLIVGITILSVTDILRKGLKLKSENDLTI